MLSRLVAMPWSCVHWASFAIFATTIAACAGGTASTPPPPPPVARMATTEPHGQTDATSGVSPHAASQDMTTKPPRRRNATTKRFERRRDTYLSDCRYLDHSNLYCRCAFDEHLKAIEEEAAKAPPTGNADADDEHASAAGDVASPAIRQRVSEVCTLAELRNTFLTSCMAPLADSTALCECEWKALVARFPGDKLAALFASGDEAAQTQAGTQAGSECSANVPEHLMREAFDTACLQGHAEMKDYCDCRWTTIRSRFAVADITQTQFVESKAYIDWQPEIVKACGSKLSESVTREQFIGECANDPTYMPYCRCAWSVLRQYASPAQIHDNLVDVPSFDLPTVCGHALPKQPGETP